MEEKTLPTTVVSATEPAAVIVKESMTAAAEEIQRQAALTEEFHNKSDR